MFPSSCKSTLAQRALDALRVTRSFLLLEDDHDVDWEVDQDESTHAAHPHRAPLRGRGHDRRPGQLEPVAHHCLSPARRPFALPAGARTRREHQPSPRSTSRCA
jgi:hypothetical protein